MRGYVAHVRLYLVPYLGQNLLADVSAVLGSLDIVFGEVDR